MELLHEILHSLSHPFFDTLKMAPILFITYLFMEWLEKKSGEKTERIVNNSKKSGPLWASVLGLIPQCSFSGAVAGMYATGTITVGTLLAVILATSDEMLPMMLGARVPLSIILTILLVKLLSGVIVGFTADFITRKRGRQKHEHIHEFCENEHCSCEDGIWISALMHTLRILLLIFVVSAALHFLVELIPADVLKSILNFPVVSQIVATLLGLIPNCAVSVTLTQLYIDSALGFSPLLCGLLSNGGVGLLVLFRVNKNMKENLFITCAVFVSSLLLGSLFGLIL